MAIKMNLVKSTSISEIGYQRKIMAVKFVNGKLYHFRKVPRSLFDKFLSSASKGNFFNKEIKANFSSLELA